MRYQFYTHSVESAYVSAYILPSPVTMKAWFRIEVLLTITELLRVSISFFSLIEQLKNME